MHFSLKNFSFPSLHDSGPWLILCPPSLKFLFFPFSPPAIWLAALLVQRFPFLFALSPSNAFHSLYLYFKSMNPFFALSGFVSPPRSLLSFSAYRLSPSFPTLTPPFGTGGGRDGFGYFGIPTCLFLHNPLFPFKISPFHYVLFES